MRTWSKCGRSTEFAEPYVAFVRPHGGFFLWVRLAEGLSAAEVQRAAAEEGASFPLGRGFFPDRHDPQEHIRLAYSWTALEDLREAAARIGRACERVARGS
jgi:DNA-binding transcriptional MocR family regulator